MVSLLIGSESSKARNKKDQARISDLWYPDIPDSRLRFSSTKYLKNSGNKERLDTKCWTLFGGYGGAWLPHLTGMFVAQVGDMDMCHISFTYDTDDVPLSHRRLGCHRNVTGHSEVWPFRIDGPGGERIVRVELDLSPSYGEILASQEVYLIGSKLRGIVVSFVLTEILVSIDFKYSH